MSFNTVTVSETSAALPPHQTTQVNELVAAPVAIKSVVSNRPNILERRNRRQVRRLSRM